VCCCTATEFRCIKIVLRAESHEGLMNLLMHLLTEKVHYAFSLWPLRCEGEKLSAETIFDSGREKKVSGG
jgi:hypothetical protein